MKLNGSIVQRVASMILLQTKTITVECYKKRNLILIRVDTACSLRFFPIFGNCFFLFDIFQTYFLAALVFAYFSGANKFSAFVFAKMYAILLFQSFFSEEFH